MRSHNGISHLFGNVNTTGSFSICEPYQDAEIHMMIT